MLVALIEDGYGHKGSWIAMLVEDYKWLFHNSSSHAELPPPDSLLAVSMFIRSSSARRWKSIIALAAKKVELERRIEAEREQWCRNFDSTAVASCLSAKAVALL